MTTSIQTCLPCKALKLSPSPSALLRHGSSNSRRNSVNRRSAVERLEESKANYVKSESVLDSKQEFKHSMHLQVGKTPDQLLPMPMVVLRPKSPAPIRARAKSQSEVRDSPTRRRISLCRRNSARSVIEATSQPNDLESQLKQLLMISTDDQPVHARDCGPSRVRRGYSDPVNRHVRGASSSVSAASCDIHKSMPDLTRRKPRTTTPPPSPSPSSDSSEDFFRVAPKNLRCLPRPSCCNRRRVGSDTSDDEDDYRNGRHHPPPIPLPSESYSLRRPVLRSKSDVVGYRSLQARRPPEGRRRNSYGGPELERFFNMLGLDSSVWQRLTSPAGGCGGSSSPPRFFESGSSIQSDDYRSSFGSDDSSRPQAEGVLLNRQLKELSPGETSIVEKNARVIKWLYNCRKAQGNLLAT